ncbi:hypothetical protein DYD21_08455 [Rhodohalobacter sp. SW132]|nr:hypothetical protein [Rhodohalobacter sp. SW132]REL37802.1 hypothetical protein DYD21_08455 [Rhodohalobacter sp. SW132]
MARILTYLTVPLLTIFLFFIQPSSILGQQTETLFDGSVSHGGFGGPVVKIGETAGDTGVWVGGRGGWIMNLNSGHAISLGGGGYGLVTDHTSPEDPDLYALNGYGGFIIEYTNRSHKLAHFTVTSLIGGGGLMLRDRDYDEVNDDPDTYFVFEPGLHAELNVTSFFRISAGAEYRFTSGISRFGFSDSDFSGWNGTITLKFGKFL